MDYQEYKPCALYLNNEYWGLHNIREMIAPNHFKYHCGANDDFVDLLGGSEINPSVDNGSATDYLHDVFEYLNTHDLSTQENYDHFKQVIDIENFNDYIVTQTYICNIDWPINNIKWWRDKTTDGNIKWRWILYDTDMCMRIENLNFVWIGDLYGIPFEGHFTDEFFVFNKLMKNEQYKKEFPDRYLFFIETVFEPSRFESIISEMKNNIASEYTHHQQKWSLSNDCSENYTIYNDASGCIIDFEVDLAFLYNYKKLIAIIKFDTACNYFRFRLDILFMLKTIKINP